MNHSPSSQLNFRFAPEKPSAWAPEKRPPADGSPLLVIRTCKHILESDHPCRAAAVRGRNYCRAHVLLRARQRKMARAHRRLAHIKLPRLTDLESVQIAEARVRVALDAGHLDPACARSLRSALHLVGAEMRFMERQDQPTCGVRSSLETRSWPRRHLGP